MSAASLSLLKGGKKAAVDEELKTQEPEAAAVEETVETQAAPEVEASDEEGTAVDVDKLSNKQLDELVAEYGIEVPAEWKKWKADGKRSWLKSQFEDDGGAEATVEAEVEAEIEKAAAAPAADDGSVADIEEKLAEAAPAKETKTTKKAASKSKAVATTSTKSGEVEVQGEDVLSDLIHGIETLKEKEARALVVTLTEETEVAFFKLGGVLSVIQANGWFEPYASFREFVEKEHGLHYRKATYWVGIYNRLAEAKVPWSKVRDIPWTKLKEIAAVITVENVDEWVEIAKKQNTLTLIDTIKAYLAKDAPEAIEDQTSKTVTTKTFKVHEDQKAVIDAAILKAKNESSTQVDTVALELICSDYLAAQTLVQKFQKMGIEAALEALEKAFPNATINVELEEAA